jgi:hypothetical protein
VDTDGDVRNIEGRVQGWIQMVLYGEQRAQCKFYTV